MSANGWSLVVVAGAVAIVDFVEDDADSDTPQPSSSTTAKASEPEVPPGDEAPPQLWMAHKWLAQIPGLLNCLATALCTDDEGNELEELAALSHVRALESKEVLPTSPPPGPLCPPQ